MSIGSSNDPYVPYKAQALAQALGQLIEEHRGENPTLSEREVAIALRIVGPSKATSFDNGLRVLRRVTMVVAIIVGLAVAVSSVGTMFKVYETVQEFGGVHEALSGS
jgi:hypothetical protein